MWIDPLGQQNEFYTNMSEKIIKILKMSSKILKNIRNYAAKIGQIMTQFLLPIKENYTRPHIYLKNAFKTLETKYYYDII